MDLRQAYPLGQEADDTRDERTHLPHGGREPWGAPRVHGELRMLGYEISERTVLRWMRKAPRCPEPARRWAAFLSNHSEAIVAMDLFTVPTLNFGMLYYFFVIAHDRRRILHCNVTKHPTSAWVTQQLREAFPFDRAPKYLIFDRGANFNEEVIETIKSFGIQPKRTSFQSPWQNGVDERFVGNCRRDLLGHVIVLNERHLKRLMTDYIRYYHEDRTHLSLSKETPGGCEVESNPDRHCSESRFHASLGRIASSIPTRRLSLFRNSHSSCRNRHLEQSVCRCGWDFN